MEFSFPTPTHTIRCLLTASFLMGGKEYLRLRPYCVARLASKSQSFSLSFTKTEIKQTSLFVLLGRRGGGIASMWTPSLSFHHVGRGNQVSWRTFTPSSTELSPWPHPPNNFLKINFIYPVWKGARSYYSYSALTANGLGWTLESVCLLWNTCCTFHQSPFWEKGAHL